MGVAKPGTMLRFNASPSLGSVTTLGVPHAPSVPAQRAIRSSSQGQRPWYRRQIRTTAQRANRSVPNSKREETRAEGLSPVGDAPWEGDAPAKPQRWPPLPMCWPR